MYRTGTKVVYPTHGVGWIEAIEKKEVAGGLQPFYVVRIIGNGMTILVPTKNAKRVGLRADKIEERLRRYKKRLKGHDGHPPGKGQIANYTVESPHEDREEPAEGFNPVVVAEGTEALKSMSVASAVAELDLTGAPVIVFEHAGTGRVNIVYRRRDGAIGWLDPH